MFRGSIATNGRVPPEETGQTGLDSIPLGSIEQRVQLYFSEMGKGPEPKPDKGMVSFQLEGLHRDYLLARSSYEAEGLSEELPRLYNHATAYMAANNGTGNVGNLLYKNLNERLGERIDAAFRDKTYNGEVKNDEVKRTAIVILAMIALKGGVEYREFDKFGEVCFSLGLERENFDFEALGFRATNNNIHYALRGLLRGGYAAQGYYEKQEQTGELKKIPALVATARLDPYLK